ncbi:hypothetical protein ACUN7V_13115 [Quadrisphaera oryzae]|uniref:hypothetical protein n=1 Tax=Quadrisphaera TaxID=317661 RepID=UPI0016478351|nr:hypothetical protein [Quadrisphaera sp. RL12-1S]MBC3763105.1 hypothetical protein [Quadrisphaera sp. RL12-1S]
MTQDPHHSSWDAPAGEQPVKPSVHDRDTGGWARPSWPAQQQPAPPQPDGPLAAYPPPPGYGPSGYGPPPGYGQAPQGHGYTGVPASAAPRGQAPTSAIVLVVLSGLLTLALSWTVVGLVMYVIPTVLSVVALARSGSDPSGARRLTRTGWIVFGVMTVVLGLLVVVGGVLLARYGFSEGGGSGGAGGVSV